MIRPIVTHPDPRLRQVSTPIAEDEFGTEYLHALAQDLFDTVKHHNAAGISAVQIGEPRRVLVYRQALVKATDPKETIPQMPVVACNPEVDQRFGTVTDVEGCLSFPGVSTRLVAPHWMIVRFRDVEGKLHERIRVAGFEARCFAHELDHLDGKLLIDRMARLARRLFLKDLEKAARGPRRKHQGARP